MGSLPAHDLVLSKLSGLLPYLRRHRAAYVTGSLVTVLLAAVTTASPAILRLAIDRLEAGIDDPLDLAPYLGGILALAVAAAIFQFIVRQSIVNASRRIEYEIRTDLYQHLQRLPKHYFDQARTGDLMTRATSDLRAVMEMLGFGVRQVGYTFTLLAFAIAFMISISVQLSLLVGVVLPVMSIVFFVLLRIIHQRYDLVQQQFSDIGAKAQENFSGIRVVKGYAIEDVEVADFKRLNAEYMKRYLSLARIESPLWPSMSMLVGIAVAIILFFGGRMVIEGVLTLGEMFQFQGYVLLLSWPMMALGLILNLVQRGQTSWQRLEEIFRARADIADSEITDHGIREIKGEIEWRDVRLTFDKTVALDGVSLRIPAGTTLALIGGTGAGKTTLINLIARLVEPTSGEVLIDGRDIREIPLAVLRSAIGMVPQETFLFSDTIGENIAYGVPAVEMDDVRRVAGIAQLAGDVDEFPEGYETILGERGVTLSGGQKQRTAIARAIMRKPPILILDDSLSAVDTNTEALILEGLREVMADRTSIIISHRVSTVRNADLIAVVEDGKIVELGRHDELVARRGLYWKLDQQQKLADELEAA